MTNNWEDQLMGHDTLPAETPAERAARKAEQAAGEAWCRAYGLPANWREAQEYAESIGDW